MTNLVDIAAQVDATAAEPYLRAHGWELVAQGDLGNRWRRRHDHRTRNVAVPLARADDADRARMLAAVLQTLMEVEQRDPALIARDLSDAASDLIEFRIIAGPLDRGEMPLRAAPELTSGAFEVVQAAARAEVARRPHFVAGTLPSTVRAFVDTAHLAGTARGSVILRVRPPAAGEPRQPAIAQLFEPEPFERRAVTRLIEGIRAARTAAHRDPTDIDLDVLDEDVEDGLSANLCDALLKLAGSESGLEARVAVRVRWALTRPTDEPATAVEIERGELRRLPDISAILKRVEPRPATTVVGPVVRLVREPGDEAGWISIHADVDGRTRVVRMLLDRSDYELAMKAHSADLEIRATGTLERAGQARELAQPSHVELVGSPSDAAF